MTGLTRTAPLTGSILANLAWILLAMVAMLWVMAINGNPLFYYDSLDYILRGTKALAMVLPDSWLRDPLGEAAHLGGADVAAAQAADQVVNASRSIVYSMLMAGFYQMHLEWWFPLFQAACVLAVVWVAARVLLRARGVDRPALPVLALPMLVAGLGALPFYVAFLMPDIFAPLMLLSVGIVTLHGRRLRGLEWAILALVSAVGVLSHPSHLLIAAALVLPAALVGWLARAPGQGASALLGAGFVAALAGLAVTERLAFVTTVKTVQKQEVVYSPFLTARLIADGPGLSYLQDKCPDAAIPTCLLYTALQGSADPMRLTATHIIFETSQNLGSFRLLSAADQKTVADAQVEFARAVALDRPGEVLLAMADNVGWQLRLNGVNMTIPEQDLVEKTAVAFPWLEPSTLSEWRGWLYRVHHFHSALNILSALVLVGVILWPGPRFARTERGLAAFVLLAVLVNAVVCGAISQPASRYGARVIWLLPLVATFLLILQGRLGRKLGRKGTA